MYYPKLDPKTGRFIKTPKGMKTPKMLTMESTLGVKFEDDYQDMYLSGKLGQKRFATRWHASKNLIFSNNLRETRRSWIQILDLAKKTEDITSRSKKEKGFSCENCGCEASSLDGAHWVERANGGSDNSYNIVKLCPNCHRSLDRNDEKITEGVRAALLYRVTKNIIEKGGNKEKIKAELIEKITPIITHRTSIEI